MDDNMMKKYRAEKKKSGNTIILMKSDEEISVFYGFRNKRQTFLDFKNGH